MAVTRVVMPKLSEAMETGRVIKWLKKEGDRVQGGDILAEVETDKADVEMEAFGSGALRKILVPAGERAPVGALIAVIAEPDDDIAAVMAQAAPPAPAVAAAPPASAAPPARAGAGSPPQPAPAMRPEAAAGPSVTRVVPASGSSGGQRVKASPLAKKIAAQAGVDLRLVPGSGPGGRVIRRDVEAARTAAAPSPAARPAAPGVEYEDRPLTAIRATIAKRMPLAKAPVPHFYLTSEVAMDRGWALREELNALEGQPKLSVNDLVIRACALALLAHPEVNASFQGESVRVWYRVHLGLAVALDEGLITPVLRDCQAKSLAQIAVEARDLVERARTRKLRTQELSGATFSISNLGMFDVREFSAIINPPEGAILAVGAVRRVPVIEQETVTVGRRMAVTLSCDHRVLDGAMGARFLQTLRQLLEEPLRLLV
jgi:pyruvate dehydrogenase E2 component (dihydrolipoamide acetyltransferase)